MVMLWLLSWHRAAALPLTIINALQKTFIRVETAPLLTDNAIETHDWSFGMIVVLVEAELGLDSGAVDAVGM